jgi:hypothetical protein
MSPSLKVPSREDLADGLSGTTQFCAGVMKSSKSTIFRAPENPAISKAAMLQRSGFMDIATQYLDDHQRRNIYSFSFP